MERSSKNFKKNESSVKFEISGIGVTDEVLSSRGGLSFFSRYVRKVNIISVIKEAFYGVRKSRKGKEIEKIIMQLINFFVDGTKFTLTRFDEIKCDEGYAISLGMSREDMSSSHSIKRFFRALEINNLKKLQKVLLKIFLWRLRVEKPEIVILGLDTMVLDNDEASKREGVTYTYKNVKGYHPVNIYWGRYVVNMAFHKGNESPNHNNDLFNMVRETIKVIRQYEKRVPIIIVSDAGFYDKKYFSEVEKLGAYFICGGKIYDSIKLKLCHHTRKEWKTYEKGDDVIEYLDFWDKRDSWERGYRTIYIKHACENGEFHLEFDRRESIVYTNLSSETLKKDKRLEKYLNGEEIVRHYHQRGRDELVNRGTKDFVDETLPFKSFVSNGAYYYLSIISYDLLVSFQKDVLKGVIPVESYPETVRRIFIDIAGRIVRSGRKIIIKFCKIIVEKLKLVDVWERCCKAIPI